MRTLFRPGAVLGILSLAAVWSVPAAPPSPDLFTELRWRCIGPFRGGRTVAAAGVPGQPGLFYVGVNNGGVWKSDDYGRVWRPIFDGQPTQSIGALAVASSDPRVIYVGSGEGLQRPDLSVGDGLYVSTDAGATFRHEGLRDAQQIGAIVVDPRDARRLFVAVLGHPYGPNAERGVFRSTDAGKTFSKSLFKDENTGAIALAIDPKNPDTLYASLWAARLAPWENGVFNGPGSGLYKSTNGGDSWRKLEKGLPAFEQGLGRIGMAIAPSDPSRIYALVEKTSETGGLFRSEDAGESWSEVNSETRITGRGSDFAELKVHPKEPDTVYVANTASYRSTDGGKTFGSDAWKGAPGGDDYHGIWIDPENPSVILLTADQGATVSVNGGATWSSWYNQPTAQLYHVSTDNRFPYWVYGGQQESGSVGIASRGDYGAITAGDWHPVAAEEYGYVAPDPLDPDLVYGGRLTRFRHSTRDVKDVSPVPVRDGSPYRFLRTVPVVFSPRDPHVLFYAAQVLFRTRNGGESWDVISPDLSRPAPDVPGNVGVYAKAELAKSLVDKRRGVIYTIAPSPKDVNLIWAGTDDGLIHVTKDGGKTWANVTPKDLTSWSKVSLLEASRFDGETAYAAINRIRLDDQHPHIYRTTDGGKTWKEIVKGLPDGPVNAVREDPERRGLLFAGTENGVHVSFDDGESWQPLRLNLPTTSVRDLVIHEDDVVVGTHGRSFWILDDITPLRQLTREVTEAGTSANFLFTPQRAVRMRRSKYPDTPLPPEEPAGQNPPDGAIVDYILGASGRGPVTLEVRDAEGRLVRSFSSDDKPEPDGGPIKIPSFWLRTPRTLSAAPGMHRFVWDLHLPAPAALEHDFPISAIPHDTTEDPLGPVVLPGLYTLALTRDGRTLTRPLTIGMDPRVKASSEDLRKQFELAGRICEAMSRDHEAVKKVRAMREEHRGRALAAKDAAGKALSELGAKLADLEEGDDKRATRNRGLVPLNSDFVTLLAVVEGADAAPTTQAVAAFAEIQEALTAVLGRLGEIERERR